MRSTMPHSDKSARAQRRRKARMDAKVAQQLKAAEEQEMARMIAAAQPAQQTQVRLMPAITVSMNTPEGTQEVDVQIAQLMMLRDIRDLTQRLVDVAEYPAQKPVMLAVAEEAKSDDSES